MARLVGRALGANGVPVMIVDHDLWDTAHA